MDSEALWKKFSLAYRKYKANKYDFCVCFTCGIAKKYNQMDTGHYIDRRHGAVKFNPLNIEIQCIKCNRFNSGNIEVFKKNIIRKYGQEVEEMLQREARSGVEMKEEEILFLIDYYKTLKLQRPWTQSTNQ